MKEGICLVGTIDYLYLALEDRLKRSGIKIISNPEDAKIKIGIDTDLPVDLLIIPPGIENKNAPLVITIHDLLIPDGHSKWSPSEIYLWLNQIKENKNIIIESQDVHYWVHLRDAVEAISMVISSENFRDCKGQLNICGRRAWSNNDVFIELKMLWTRYYNSVNYAHTVESLSQIPNPVSRNRKEMRERPSLASLNLELLRAGGDGWHPLTPLRTGLMELLAQNP